MTFDHARAIADAVLYEGYVLYPYRASARKNRFRFQFGVLAPRAFHEAGGGEAHRSVTEIVIEPDASGGLAVTGKLRCLQLQRRSIERWRAGPDAGFHAVESLELDGRLLVAWDEAIERVIDLRVTVGEQELTTFVLPGAMSEELLRGPEGEVLGRVVRHVRPIEGALCVACLPCEGDLGRRAGVEAGPFTVRVEIDNRTPYEDPTLDRDQALRASLLGAHVMLHASRGAFVSLLDPPARARAHVEACENLRAFPVLVGPEGSRDTVLASPVVLYDWPAVAPESQGDFCDALEIDELPRGATGR